MKNRMINSTVFNIAVHAILFSALIFGSGAALSDDADDDEAKAPATKATPDKSAPEGKPSLAEQATNPVAMLMQLRLQDQYTASYRNADSYGNAALFQGVFPSALGGGWGSAAEAMITRVTLPYVTTPKVPGANGYERSTGMGDMSVLGFFVTSWLPKGQVFAWGPSLTVPTAGDNEATGAGQWQLGPTAVYLNTITPKIQWGLMAFQNWSFSKTRDNATKQSILSLQPIFTKHFNDGWYVALPDSPQTYNFETSQWALHLGGVVGRVMKWGRKPIQLFGEVTYNPMSYDDVVTDKLSFKINLSFLITE
jgi:hypothetical protein